MTGMEYTHAYIGKKPCGCVVACVVDMPDHKKSTADDVAEFIKEGYVVQHIAIGSGIQMAKCRCEEKKVLMKQVRLIP
jgi:hypothetical protein